MEYPEAVNKLEGLRRIRPKLGTATTATLLEGLDVPYGELDAVQVAGSNGKGSTAAALDRILRAAGLDVGLYTSPDLNDVRERVRVNGRKIPKRAVRRFVEDAWPDVVDLSARGEGPTFFEAFTAMALWHFAREDVDVAVLEVGIGGRYDATSVVDPVAAAVSNVSLEHTDILGETVAEIARDKAQVAPAGVPLVTGATGPALETIREEADVLTVGGEDADVVATERAMRSHVETTVSLEGPDWSVETRTTLLGAHQAVNVGIAATLARQVAEATEADIASGLRDVHWPGRFEVIDDDPLVVLDGAHNAAACETLATLLGRFDYDDLHLVFGAMRDKDHAEMYRSLPPAVEVILAEPDVDRAQDLDTLAAILSGSDASVRTAGSVLDAVDRAHRRADETDCVLVTGSLYMVAEARDRWTRVPRIVATESTDAAADVLGRADVTEADREAHVDRLVHRTVRLHARRDQARVLRAEMLSVGGDCLISGIEAANGHVEVVLAGTLDQYRALLEALSGQPGGFGHLRTQLTDALSLEPTRAHEGLPWDEETAVMGILNVTPDSFHDGGQYDAVDDAVARAEEMVAAGAAIVDVGGESTRPGADPVPADEERTRVVPVVEGLSDLDAVVSVDTRKPAVAEAALDAGADMVNDVTGLADSAMRRLVADRDVPVVVMHSLSAPVDPAREHTYDDVVDDVLADLLERVLLAERAGIDRSRILVDPGLGFGTGAADSFELLDRLDEFRGLGCPVMIGHSHKSMFDHVGRDPDERLAPTVAATALATERGVDVVRVHDVAPNVGAVATAETTRRSDPP
jgi:dihydropteroate synthase